MVNISIKRRCILAIFIVFISFNISILKGMESEEDKGESYSKVASLEDKLPNAIEDSVHIGSQSAPSSSSLGLGHISDLHASQDENLINGLSNSYVAAFQQELDAGVSRYEALKYFISVLGSLGPIIPQVAIAQTMARQHFGSDIVGYVMIGLGVVSISSINSWIISELIDDTHSFIKSARQPQKNLSTCSSFNCLKNLGIVASSITLGTISSVANVYLNYEYNSNKWFALITFIYDAIPKTIGFYKFSSLLKVENIKRIWKEPDEEERRGVQIINLSQAYFLEKCKEKGIENVRKDLLSCNSAKEVYLYLTSNTNLERTTEELPRDFARGIPKKIVKYSSIFLPLVSSTFNFVLAYKGYNLVLSEEWSVLLSTLSVAPSFFLSSYVMMESAGNVFDKISLCKSSIPSSDYFASFYPKLNATFLGSAMFLASISSLVAYYLITDNLEDTFFDSVKYPIAGIIMCTGFTFDTFTIYTSFKRYGEIICKKFSKGASYAIDCSKKLGNLGSSFINFSSALVKKFIDDAVPEYEDALEQN